MNHSINQSINDHSALVSSRATSVFNV